MTAPALFPAHYTNWMPFVAQDTADGLSIVCRSTPRGAIVLHGGVITAGFCGFGVLTYTKAPAWFWFTLVLGALTLGGFLTHVIWFHRDQQQRGPVLVFDRKSATIALPRESRMFRSDEIDCICLVEGHAADEPACQLQLHLRSGDPVLLASGYHGSLDPMFNALASGVPVPAHRYSEGKKG
jgi:hypothetical protein